MTETSLETVAGQFSRVDMEWRGFINKSIDGLTEGMKANTSSIVMLSNTVFTEKRNPANPMLFFVYGLLIATGCFVAGIFATWLWYQG